MFDGRAWIAPNRVRSPSEAPADGRPESAAFLARVILRLNQALHSGSSLRKQVPPAATSLA